MNRDGTPDDIHMGCGMASQRFDVSTVEAAKKVMPKHERSGHTGGRDGCCNTRRDLTTTRL